VGRHAVIINQINAEHTEYVPVRERIGHTKIEIITGILVGIMVAIAFSAIF